MNVSVTILILITALMRGAWAIPDHNVIGCGIYDSHGKAIRVSPGKRCLFFPDGGFISTDGVSVTRYGPNLDILWHVKSHNHHLVRPMSDQDFLIGGSDVRFFLGKITRFDVLQKWNRNGKIVRSFNFYDHLADLRAADPTIELNHVVNFDWDADNLPGVEREFSHLNSAYEIPENPTAGVIPAFRKGNIIVNVNIVSRVFILDKDLRQILWTLKYMKGQSNVHDVQVLPNGHLLVYNNSRSNWPCLLPKIGESCDSSQAGVEWESWIKFVGVPYSSIEEYDSVGKKIVWEYHADPPSSFYAYQSGGVQILPNRDILFNDPIRAEAYEIDRSGKTKWAMSSPWREPVTGSGVMFQEIKRHDLTQFLKNNHGI